MGERQRYCGLCPGYGDHDTAHHDKGEIAQGDRVSVEIDGREQECQVLEVRGHEARLATRRKDIRWLPVKQLTRVAR